MLRRATTTIRVDDRLVLRPATSEYGSELIEAFEETWPEVSRAMPWVNPDQPLDTQIEDFLVETERMGRTGMLHHWVMVRPWDGALLGLVGFDRVTRSNKAFWIWVTGYAAQSSSMALRARPSTPHWLGLVRQRSTVSNSRSTPTTMLVEAR